VDACVNPELAVGLAGAFQDAPFGVDHEQGPCLGKARAAARGQQERVRSRNARARVAEGAREAHALEDSIGGRDVVAQRANVLHIASVQATCTMEVQDKSSSEVSVSLPPRRQAEYEAAVNSLP